MSRDVKQPIGQKRLTNIATVRFKKMGKRFEIACYKNTVVNWRNGVEKDINEVVQTTTVFANVSKGVLAKRGDLKAAFGTVDDEAVCRVILADGDLQVLDKERKVHYDALYKDVANILVDKCVNPETNRPYTNTMVERALKEAHFAVDPKRSAKQQALEAIPVLQQVIPLRRASMRLKLQVAPAAEHDLELLLRQHGSVIEKQEASSVQVTVICLSEPGRYRDLHAFVQRAGGRWGQLEVLALAASQESDARSSPPTAASKAASLSGLMQHTALADTTADSSLLQSYSGQQQRQSAIGPSGYAVAASSVPVEARAPSTALQGELLYSGIIAGLSDEHASRRERFADIDTLQPGWRVELRSRGDTVAPSFLSPSGERFGSYAASRRAALAASKAAATSA